MSRRKSRVQRSEQQREWSASQALLRAAITGDAAVVVAEGRAGSGKTSAAVSAAVEGLLSNRFSRVTLARPAVSSGRDLGALPGGVEDKVAAYLEPAVSEAAAVAGESVVGVLVDTGRLAFRAAELLRGHNVRSGELLIVSEAQNLSDEQLLMIITRVCVGGCVVLEGDRRQTDLRKCHFSQFIDRIRGIEGVVHVALEGCHRHPVVARIISAVDGEEEFSLF